MLLTLCAVLAALLIFPDGFSGAGSRHAEKFAALVLPVLCALSVAPWLTMLCRSPIAGTVFTIAIPGILLVVGEVSGAAYGLAGPEVQAFSFAVFWRVMLGICAIAAVMSWRMFMRLEVIDGRGQDLRLPSWLVRRTRTRTSPIVLTKRHPLRLLARKELRLQPMTLAVAGLYFFGWLRSICLYWRCVGWRYCSPPASSSWCCGSRSRIIGRAIAPPGACGRR